MKLSNPTVAATGFSLGWIIKSGFNSQSFRVIGHASKIL